MTKRRSRVDAKSLLILDFVNPTAMKNPIYRKQFQVADGTPKIVQFVLATAHAILGAKQKAFSTQD